MDPFTEKLLERTRARRENLQKKMAERPNAANRPMTKRAREPLAETNSMSREPVVDKAPHPSAKPSPSKKRCSEENLQPAAGEENREPAVIPSVAPAPTDPQTDRKPPVGPSSVRSAASLERASVRPTSQPPVAQPTRRQGSADRQAPAPEVPVPAAAPEPQQTSRDVEMVVPANPAPLTKGEEPEDAPPTPSTGGMKSRLQRLAEQRQYWDAGATSDTAPACAPPSPVKTQRQLEAPASEAPVGRKGRLANLAATIGNWEDDLSHVNTRGGDGAQRPPGKVWVHPSARGDAAAASPTFSSEPRPSASQQPVHYPVKSSGVVPPSPKKTEVPEAKPAAPAARLPSPVASPQKSNLSNQGRAFPSSPQKVGPSTGAPVSHSPLKNQARSSAAEVAASPKKPELLVKPSATGASVVQTREKFIPKDSAPPYPSNASGTPGVKSFLERFGERCQERSNHGSPAAGPGQAKTPTVTPCATPTLTPGTKLVQERLRAAQAANTATADLTQKQKMERESELAQIRNRFQKGNVWKNKEEQADPKTNIVPTVTEQPKVVEALSEEDITVPSAESFSAAPKASSAGNDLLTDTPPVSASSPLKRVDVSVEEVVREVEMNVDQSITSDVINELFNGALEQSGEEEEEEEEDPLNISSMSLLTPLAETVAAVVRSPERRVMTSTPAGSFCENSKTPEGVSRPSKFQRAHVLRAGSSDGVEAFGDNLPYSIDAYRSTRVKETERPHVKQVMVRKEEVGRQAEEPRGSSHAGIKQRMKVLSAEVNLQQTVIHQASQALNCCTDEEHGRGSQVEAEAERLLLIATERRVALNAELDRMKGEGPAGPRKAPAGPSKAQEDAGLSASKGSISLLELRLPLKADFVCSTANKPESANHYFFLMIRAGAENTVATPLTSTRNALSGDALNFTTKFTMSDVSNDFEIDLEIYSLVQKREQVTEKKKKPKSKAITPKRFLAITKSNQTPVMASPGGPNAVRTSNFALVGSHKLTLSSIGKSKFPLDKVPFLCPLEGHIHLKLQCEVGCRVEDRGFLTMFEDVSGFGAWHRRWCVLSGYCISYWTYPDDEKRKNPMGRINLANCTSRKVEPANREFCARPNTFELITVRPQRENDKETLVSQCQNTMCVTKNWLSADTKDERNLWMLKLNQILVDLRMWQPDSCYRPV
ncbi:anillin [Aplochiton taeniatus]